MTSTAKDIDSDGNADFEDLLDSDGDAAKDRDSDFEDLSKDDEDLGDGSEDDDQLGDFQDNDQEGEMPAAVRAAVSHSDAELEESDDESNGNVIYGAIDDETIEQAGQRLFPVASMWATKEKLKESLTRYGLAFGFGVLYSRGWTFACNKAGFTKDRKKKTATMEVWEDKVPKTAKNFVALCMGNGGRGRTTGAPLHYKVM
jgi:hypothetical protein